MVAKRLLGKRQQDIFNFICSYQQVHGYSPSIREICGAVGLASPSTVHTHLKVLEDLGYISHNPNKPRTIELATKVSDTSGCSSEELLNAAPSAATVSIPLVGSVSADGPIFAEENREDTFVLPASIVSDAHSFILRVRGDSMIQAGIFANDYVVVRQQATAASGDIVVALVDGEATIKTFYCENDRIRLQPENDAMEPIYPKDLQILGRVTALIRSIV